MPISQEYGGHGDKVMANMTKEYGADTGKRVFYATLNKRKNEGKGPGIIGQKKKSPLAESLRSLQGGKW